MMQDVSQSASAQLAAWYARRPSFALMGEYSAGKSALLNTLLGRPLLPTRVTATDLPAVWITHGPDLRLTGLSYAGDLVELSAEDLTGKGAMTFLCIRIETDAAILTTTDIIDTPGISDPRLSTAIVEVISQYIDFAVWCSPMNQAWRQTERAFWNRFPATVKAGSILALTRADMMRNASDVAKVVKRCAAETAGSFAAVVPFSAHRADAAVRSGTPDEREGVLRESGLPEMLRLLERSVALAAGRCAATKVEAEKPGPGAKQASSARKKRGGTQVGSKTVSDGQASALVRSLIGSLRPKLTDAVTARDLGAILQDATAALGPKDGLKVDHLSVLRAALHMPRGDAPDVARATVQVIEELEDFIDGAWCPIDN